MLLSSVAAETPSVRSALCSGVTGTPSVRSRLHGCRILLGIRFQTTFRCGSVDLILREGEFLPPLKFSWTELISFLIQRVKKRRINTSCDQLINCPAAGTQSHRAPLVMLCSSVLREAVRETLGTEQELYRAEEEIRGMI